MVHKTKAHEKKMHEEKKHHHLTHKEEVKGGKDSHMHKKEHAKKK